MIQPANNSSRVAISSEQPEVITVKRPKNVSFLVINQNKSSDYSPAVKALACVATGVFIGGLGVVAYKNWNTLRIPLVKLFTPGTQLGQTPTLPPETHLDEETIKTLKSLQRYLDAQTDASWESTITIIKIIGAVGLVALAKMYPNGWLTNRVDPFSPSSWFTFT